MVKFIKGGICMLAGMSYCRICGKPLGDYYVHTEYYKFIEENEKLGNLGGFICHKCVIEQSGIKKLYHASYSCDIIEEFIPRIPEFRAEGLDENNTIPRICLSDSIEGCLSAVPWGGSRLEDLFWEEGSCLIRIYEFDIKDLNLKNLLPPEYLYSSDLVRDSNITREYWYIDEKLKPSRSYLIEIRNYDTYWPDIISFDDYLNGMYTELNNEYFDWEDAICGHVSQIRNLEYNKIPEERRSGVFRLNHKIEGIKEDDFTKIETDIVNEYPTTRTWVDFEKREDGIYLVGELDTRRCFEMDTERIIDFLNERISKGKIQRQ